MKTKSWALVFDPQIYLFDIRHIFILNGHKVNNVLWRQPNFIEYIFL